MATANLWTMMCSLRKQNVCTWDNGTVNTDFIQCLRGDEHSFIIIYKLLGVHQDTDRAVTHLLVTPNLRLSARFHFARCFGCPWAKTCCWVATALCPCMPAPCCGHRADIATSNRGKSSWYSCWKIIFHNVFQSFLGPWLFPGCTGEAIKCGMGQRGSGSLIPMTEPTLRSDHSTRLAVHLSQPALIFSFVHQYQKPRFWLFLTVPSPW